jgi:hypothetical protein
MPVNCFKDFREATKGYFENKKDARDFYDHLVEKAESKQYEALASKSEKYNKSAEDLIEQKRFEFERRKKEVFMNLQAKKVFDNFVERFPAGQKAKAGLAFIGGIESNIKGTKDSVVNAIKSGIATSLGNLVMKLDEAGLREVFNEAGNELELAKALWGEAVKDSNIQKVAAIIKESENYVRKRLNSLGAFIGEGENRITRQSHNSIKMRSVTGSSLKDMVLRKRLVFKLKGDAAAAQKIITERAFMKWKNLIVPLTNLEKTLENVKDPDRFWKSFWRHITTGESRQSAVTQESPFVIKTGSNIARKLSSVRKWFPKDAESWVKYNKEYGMGSLQEAVRNSLYTGGRAIGIMSKLGTNPANLFERLLKKLASDNSLDFAKNRLMKRAKNISRALFRSNASHVETLGGHIINSFRNLVYATKLGNVLVASFPDINNIALALKPYGEGHLKAIEASIGSFIKGMPKGEMKKIAISLGTYSDSLMGSTLSRYGGINIRQGLMAKLMRLNEHMTFIHRWDNPQTAAFSTMISEHLGSFTNIAFEDLKPGVRTNLLRYNIGEQEWKLIRANAENLKLIGNKKFLTPDFALNMSDESISTIYYGNKGIKTSAAKLEKARFQLHDRLKSFFIEETAYAKPIPDAVDRAIMYGGTDPSSMGGQLWRLVTMLKSWQMSAARRIWGRMLLGGGAQNVHQALAQGTADFGGMTKYVLGSMPYTYISLAMKSIALGRGLPNLGHMNTWNKIIAEPTFIYGDYLLDDYTRYSGLQKKLVGPVINTIADLLRVTQRTFQGKEVKSQWANLALNNVPLYKNFGFRTAADLILINNLREKIDPNFRHKKLQRARKNGETLLGF